MKKASTVFLMTALCAAIVISLFFIPATAMSQNRESYETVDWNPNGDYIALGTGLGQVFILNAQTGQQVASIDLPLKTSVTVVRWSPNGRYIGIGIAFNTNIYIWDSNANQITSTLSDGNTSPQTSTNELSWSPDGSKIAVAQKCDSQIYEIRIWDVASEQIEITFEQGENLLNAIAWSADGTMIAVENQDSLIEIRETTSWNPITTLVCHQGVMSVSWQPNGTKIATVGSNDETVRICDTATGELISTIHTTFVLDAKWSPDGTELALVDGLQIRVVNAATGENLFTFEPTVPAREVAWSPNGSQVAFASYNAPSVILDIPGLRATTTPSEPPTFVVATEMPIH